MASASSASAASATARRCRPQLKKLNHRLPLFAAALAALALAHLPARAAAQCPISLTFFPDGAGADNRPTAWSKRNQTEAGNARDDALLPIALYGVPTPKLHASPLSPVLGPAGGLVPGACASGGAAPAATTRRRRDLLQAGEAGGTLAVPATYSFHWSLDGKAPPREGLGGPAVNVTTGAPIFSSAELGEIWDLADGAHTLTFTFTVAAGSGRLSDGTPVPSADLVVSRTAVFYKLLSRPTAKVAFNTCQPAFTIGMTDMKPDAIAMLDTNGQVVASPDSPNVPAAFLRPVYHVWGRFQSGMDGKPFEGEDNDGSREWHFFDRYYVREIGAPAVLDVEKADLAAGYYEASVEGSLTSDFPSLVALSGADIYGQEGTVYTSFGPGGAFAATDLSAKHKFNGAFVQGMNGTRVGVQRAPSALLSLTGPDVPPAAGERVEFSWQWHGLGNATCAIDGVPRGNLPAAQVIPSSPLGACVSPYAVTVPDERNRTLSVTFEDVCGQRRTESLVFAAGRPWTTDAVLDGLAMADSALPLQDPMLGSASLLQSGGGGAAGGMAGGRGRNGAGASSAATAALLGAAAVLAMAVGL